MRIRRSLRRWVAAGFLILVLGGAGAGCGSDQTPIENGPLKQDGTRSSEFEQDDLDRADEASDAVKDYCSGAVSEAQRIGCESHVSESDIP
ncbi:MAG: hypothetical protein ACRDKE_05550 [Solirubrobacterales bacterium]